MRIKFEKGTAKMSGMNLKFLVNKSRLPATLLFLSVIFLSVLPAAFAENPWQLRKNDRGIQVHTRKVEGSPILEYKAVMKADAPIEKVLAFFEKEQKMPLWFHQCTASRLVREDSPDSKVLYFVLDLPWPVSDRDTVYMRQRSVDPAGVVTYHLSALPHEIPRKDGLVRIPYLKSFWRFTPLEGGGTEVFFQQHGNVGGNIPAALVNRLAVDIPYNTFRGFTRELAADK